MIKPEILDAMVAAGCTAEQIAAVVKASQARTSNAERQARYRARKASRVTESDVTSVTRNAGYVTDPSPKERSPTPPKEITPSRSEDKSSSLTPRDELRAVVDGDRAQAVVDHRKAIGKKLTPHAAKLLAREFAKTPDPNASADAMVANGWQGFKAEWMEQRARGSPQRQGNGWTDALKHNLSEHHGHEGTDNIDELFGAPGTHQPSPRRGYPPGDAAGGGGTVLDLQPVRPDRH